MNAHNHPYHHFTEIGWDDYLLWLAALIALAWILFG